MIPPSRLHKLSTNKPKLVSAIFQYVPNSFVDLELADSGYIDLREESFAIKKSKVTKEQIAFALYQSDDNGLSSQTLFNQPSTFL